MKKIFLFILFAPFLGISQTTVNSLPTKTTGVEGDYLIKNDSAGGTYKITVGSFKDVYIYTDTLNTTATQWYVDSIKAATTNTLTSGTGISINSSAPSFTITNSAPDQTVNITGAGTTTVSGTYPTFTVTGATTNTYSAGTGISIGGSSPSFTVTNSAPDQTVTIGEGTAINIAGTYPTFTVTADTFDLATRYTVDSVSNTLNKGSIAFNIYEGGGVVATGAKNYVVTIPYACTITGFNLFSTSAGVALNSNTVMDVWKETAGTLPTVANTIFSGNAPTLSTSSYDTDSSLSISVSAGDVIIVAVTSNSAATNLNLIINYTKN